VHFPDQTNAYPELERLWAMNRIEDIKRQVMIGKASESEAKDAERDLGVAYQIVTDETSMLVLNNAAFEKHGVQRLNQSRIELEEQARTQRRSAPVAQQRVDTANPMFNKPARRISFGGGGGGGGAIEDWLAALICLSMVGLLLHKKVQQCRD
jgi:Ca-activated chloride channel family protein